MIGTCDRCGREDEVLRAYGRLFCPNCVEELSYRGAAWYLRRAAEREEKLHRASLAARRPIGYLATPKALMDTNIDSKEGRERKA